MVKLKSGREIELRGLTFREKIPIKDTYYGAAFTTGNLSHSMYSLCVQALSGIGIKDKDLESYTDEEIFEAGQWVLMESDLIESQKKS